MHISFGIAVAFLLAIASSDTYNKTNSLKLFAEWKQLEYRFPSEEIKQTALLNGDYVIGNSVPIDVDVDYKANGASRVFVTIPRFVTGIPFTLGIVSGNLTANGPIVNAYPGYSWQSSQGKNCDGITSVFRVAIDECHRLWILDTGRVGENQLCNPQLLVFDLNTDKLIHTYKIPYEQIQISTSTLITPVVDVRDPPPSGTCSNTMVYIADVTGFAILVYDSRLNISWRVQNKLAFPHPHFGTFTIAGQSFDLMDGLFGLALSPKAPQTNRMLNIFQHGGASNRDRVLYFHALAGVTENKVPLRLLDNSSIWDSSSSINTYPRQFVEIGSRGTQSGPQAMDRNGNLFFGLMNPIGIGCWDSSKPYNRDNIKVVAQNDETLQFTSGLKVVLNKKGKEELWVLSCRFQRVMTNTLNNNEVNFRIQALQIDELLGGNKCIPPVLPTPNIGFPRY